MLMRVPRGNKMLGLLVDRGWFLRYRYPPPQGNDARLRRPAGRGRFTPRPGSAGGAAGRARGCYAPERGAQRAPASPRAAWKGAVRSEFIERRLASRMGDVPRVKRKRCVSFGAISSPHDRLRRARLARARDDCGTELRLAYLAHPDEPGAAKVADLGRHDREAIAEVHRPVVGERIEQGAAELHRPLRDPFRVSPA